MQIPFTPVVVLLLAVVAQAFFAAGLLWAAPANRRPNRFLALLMLAIALWLLDGFFRVANIYGQNPDWYFAPIYYSFAFGPLLYFYVQSLVNRDFRLRRRQLWHFAPVLVQAALYGWLRTQDYDTRNWFWQTIHQPYTYRVEFIGTWVSLMVYFGLSWRRLRHYRRYLDDNFSETSALRLRWLRTLLLLLAVVSGQWLVEVVLREFFGIYYRYDYSTELLGGVLLLIGVVGLRQADMGAVRFAEDETDAGPDPNPTTRPAAASVTAPPLLVTFGASLPVGYESAAPEPAAFGPAVGASPQAAGVFPAPTAPLISPADAPAPPPAEPASSPASAAAPETEAAGRETQAVDPAVQERIRRAFEDEQLYRNPTLTLAELAAHTGLPARLISFTVNKGFGKSFNDLVNGYRVAEVQRRLARTDDAMRLTLLGIAFESGFNSKTTFNRIFKQFTGLAPSEFGRGR